MNKRVIYEVGIILVVILQLSLSIFGFFAASKFLNTSQSRQPSMDVVELIRLYQMPANEKELQQLLESYDRLERIIVELNVKLRHICLGIGLLAFCSLLLNCLAILESRGASQRQKQSQR